LVPIPADEPVIGVVGNGAWFSGAISPGAAIAITGANLSVSTRPWALSDFNGNLLPLSLDGVSVTVGGKPAAISYISPGQINAVCPDMTVTGTSTSVNVQLVTQGHLSNSFTTQMSQFAPALFPLRSPSGVWYAAAVHADGALVGEPGDFGIASTRPAIVGEVISVFGTGFGPSIPPIPANSLPAESEPLALSPQVTILYSAPQLTYAGIVGPGLVQLNFVVPNQNGEGLTPIEVSAGGVNQPSDQALSLSVRLK
jgi:uncharacterized protein (TIGR03437 family)